MKKAVRILGIAAAILCGAAIAGVIVLKKMFPPEKIKESVTQQVSQKLKREVKLGEIKIGLFSGVSISDFALSESPSFKNGTFVQSQKFILKFQLWPLLKKKVLIDEITLESPQIMVVQNADGKTFNFSDMISPSVSPPTPKQETAPDEPAAPIAITITKARIFKGKVEFVDRSPRKIKIDLNPIDLTVMGSGLDKPMSIDLTVGLNATIQKKTIQGTLKSKTVADISRQRIEINSLQWKMTGLTLDLNGQVENFARPELNLTMSVPEGNLAELSPWVLLPKEVHLSGFPKIRLNAKGNLDRLDIGFDADSSAMSVRYADLFIKDDKTPLSVKMNASVMKQKDMTLDSLKLQLAAMEIEIKGNVQNIQSADPNVKISVTVSPFEVREIAKLSPLASPYSLAGKLSIQANAGGSAKTLKYGGSMKLEKIGAQYEKINLEDLSGAVNFSENAVEISPLDGKLGPKGKTPSDFRLRSSVKNFKNPDINLNADFSTLDLDMFMSNKEKEQPKEEKKETSEPTAAVPYKGPEISIQGNVRVGKLITTGFEGNKVELAWKLLKVTPPLNKMDGSALMRTADGNLNMKNIKLLKHLGSVLETANKYAGSSLLDPSAMVFEKIDGTFLFQSGVMKTENFQIHSPKADIYQKGTIRLSDMDKNLSVSLKLAKGSIGGTVGQFMTDDDGRPTLAFKVTGTDKTQKISMDTSVVQKRATEELKKKGTEVLQNEGKKLLEGLFKR